MPLPMPDERRGRCCWRNLRLDAALLQEEEEEAKAEAEKARPGLTMFTDGSRMEDGAAGYAAVWKKGVSWAGIKTHMGYNQEAYDTEWAALARALGLASRRNMAPERVTVFTDAQAAIRDGIGRTRSWAAVRPPGAEAHCRVAPARPAIIIEIRWPSTQGNRRQREGRRVGKDCCGGARHPRCGIAELL